MSAYIVNRSTVNLLAHALTTRGIAAGLTADQVGRELWKTNVDSIHHRYPDTAENDSNYPGPEGFRKSHASRYRAAAPLDHDLAAGPYRLVSEAETFDYQACEHPGWENSRARSWIAGLLDAAQREVDASALLSA